MEPGHLNAISERINKSQVAGGDSTCVAREMHQCQLDIRALLADIHYFLSDIHYKITQQ